MEYIFIKQHGARRTGTNYLFTLLHENFSNVKVLTNQLGWKHGGLKNWQELHSNKKSNYVKILGSDGYSQLGKAIETDKVYVAVSIKNPYAWIESLQRYERINYSTDDVKRHIEGYSARYGKWKDDCIDNYKNGFMVRYEDMLTNYRNVLRSIEEDTGLKRNNKHLHNVSKAVGPRSKQKNFSDYYLNHRYLDKLKQKHIVAITENVNWELMKYYGYKPQR